MAVDMFIKIGDIVGESQDSAHKTEIEMLAWSWGLSNTTSIGSATAGAGSGKAHFQDLSLTKYIDSSSNALMKACVTGAHYPEATLTIRKAGGTAVEYVVLTLKMVFVTSISTGGSGGEDKLTENVTLTFGAFQFKYQPQDAKGAKLGGTKDVMWSQVLNKESVAVA